ncbi:hypothetical protein GCM10011613_21270 [Cellvibrio zantedeschiae]|uniref:Uncharacterized protein n=1 Tax=Cellvibrio zantedeschiae TaxID=1237077 RepID=A0ABQ3B2I6_9GAMM|nr:hypothetical protein [Cellvibrio zantedeschiae]GGY75501.1 hypothetical protein GCM10011613_21270 [Cellvibrio zantedeschiae]
MNELHRQMYLSALGLDTYMPRLHLPFAAISIACELPIAAPDSQPTARVERPAESFVSPIQQNAKPVSSEVSPVGNLIGNMFDVPKVARAVSQPVTAADILAQLDAKPVTIEPFSLSIWRPFDGLMVVDSRNTKLALPTELLLNNILRAFFLNQSLKTQEEVLRWPMIENSFTKRTVADARNELQTWLSVQHEIRPIRYLWLMGANAATYLLPENSEYKDNLFKSVSLADGGIDALILPSLNECLQTPTAKQQLYFALRVYLSAHQ